MNQDSESGSIRSFSKRDKKRDEEVAVPATGSTDKANSNPCTFDLPSDDQQGTGERQSTPKDKSSSSSSSGSSVDKDNFKLPEVPGTPQVNYFISDYG